MNYCIWVYRPGFSWRPGFLDGFFRPGFLPTDRRITGSSV